MRALGRKQCGGLFMLADDLMNFSRLHSQVALSVSEMLPVTISMLFSEDAKRIASTTGTPDQPIPPSDVTSFQTLMTSPWKVFQLAGMVPLV